MKYLLTSVFIVIAFSCSNPRVAPQTSAAVNLEKQTEILQKQNELLAQQNQYLKRIAEALEANSK
jgi:hypothetical protein